MPEYIVTFTSPVITADSPEEAIDRAGDFKGGGHWEAEPTDQVHLAVYLAPGNVLDHFEGEPLGDALRKAYEEDPSEFAKACHGALGSDVLWNAFHDVCEFVAEDVLGYDAFQELS